MLAFGSSNEINRVGLHSASTFGRTQSLKPNSFDIFQLFIQEDNIINVYTSKATPWCGLKMCVYVCVFTCLYFLHVRLNNIFKVLSTVLFLLDYFDDSIFLIL